MIIIGTAGHIDHGKTTLTAALTGVHTDRLKEEQERGISIELGFAYLDLPSGQRCGVVDVPGHERFVRHMIAGAAGVDVVLLVIAADEGVMPQTREHLDICRLLGVRHGLVVLTKVDLVDSDWLDLVSADVEETVAGTFLEGAPQLRFSSERPELVAAFRSALFEWLEGRSVDSFQRDPDRAFRLSVDRAFTIRGFGTVVTGTVGSGTLAVGHDVELLPMGLRSRVRGIEVHGEKVDSVAAGSRAAINLQGIEKQEVPRGSALVRAGELQPTSMFDATILLLPHVERYLEQRAKALVHIGTEQVQGTIVPLDRQVMEPGQEGLVQVRLDRPIVVQAGESYVLRGFDVLANYGKTLAGGRVLDPHPRRHKSMREDVLAPLRVLRDGTPAERAATLVGLGGAQGLMLSDVVRRSDASQNAVSLALDEAVASGAVVRVTGEPPQFLSAGAFSELWSRLHEQIGEHHAAFPWRPGIPSEELRGRIRPPVEARLFAFLVEHSERRGDWRRDGEFVRLADFEPKLEGEVGAAYDALLATYRGAGLEPPLLQDATKAAPGSDSSIREAVDALVRGGLLVRVSAELYFARETLEGLQRQLVEFLEREREISTAQFKELTGLSRKFSIPLGEWFDAQKVTVRTGDSTRSLRPKLVG